MITAGWPLRGGRGKKIQKYKKNKKYIQKREKRDGFAIMVISLGINDSIIKNEITHIGQKIAVVFPSIYPAPKS